MSYLHAQKSRCLASGRRDLTQNLRNWENRILELRNQPKLEGDLLKQVNDTTPLRKRTRLLPEAIYTAIPREKLERYDRVWEAQLAAEACTLGRASGGWRAGSRSRSSKNGIIN